MKVQFPFSLIVEDIDQLADRPPLDDLALIVILNPLNYLKNSEHVNLAYQVFIDGQAKFQDLQQPG